MTTFILATQRIVPSVGIQSRIARGRDIFLAMNARGLLTMALLGLAAIGVAGYAASVAYSFNLGVQLRAAAGRAAQEERAVKNLEVALLEHEANFAVRNRVTLEGMDVVSSVIYLESGSVAMR